MANLKQNNDMAVSPIVATLVLIVVAVIGAVAVGTIMGTFSSDVSKQANTGQVSGASSNEILVAGSTTVQPATEEIAKVYMKAHPGMKITVQGGGSGAGVASVGSGVVDVGASSDLTKITDAQNNHADWDLKSYQIGGSAVVFIVSNELSATPVAATRSQLEAAYLNGAAIGGVVPIKVYQRSESSGTEETVAKYLSSSANTSLDSYTAGGNATAAVGNSGVYNAVRDATTPVLGFADMGFVYDTAGNQIDPSKVSVVNVDTFTTTKDNIKDAVKIKVANPTGTSTKYPTSLARGLYLMTKGTPNSVVANFVQFCQSPGADDAIHAAGVFSNADLA